MFQSRIDELKSQFGDRLSQKLHLIKSAEWNGIKLITTPDRLRLKNWFIFHKCYCDLPQSDELHWKDFFNIAEIFSGQTKSFSLPPLTRRNIFILISIITVFSCVCLFVSDSRFIFNDSMEIGKSEKAATNRYMAWMLHVFDYTYVNIDRIFSFVFVVAVGILPLSLPLCCSTVAYVYKTTIVYQ